MEKQYLTKVDLRDHFKNPFEHYNNVKQAKVGVHTILHYMQDKDLILDDVVAIDSNVNGKYNIQRDYCWTLDMKQKYVESLIKNMAYGVFVIGTDYQNGRRYVIDGKQRANALMSFVNGDFDVKLPNGYFVNYKKMDETSQRQFKNSGGVLLTEFDMPTNGFSEKELLEIFLSLNTSGAPQSEEFLNDLKEKYKKLTANV